MDPLLFWTWLMQKKNYHCPERLWQCVGGRGTRFCLVQCNAGISLEFAAEFAQQPLLK